MIQNENSFRQKAAITLWTLVLAPCLTLPPMLFAIPVLWRLDSYWALLIVVLSAMGSNVGVALVVLRWIWLRAPTTSRREEDEQLAKREPSDTPAARPDAERRREPAVPPETTEDVRPDRPESEPSALFEVPEQPPYTHPELTADSGLDRRLWKELKEYLGDNHVEEGGFLLGFRKNGHAYFTGAVFPGQVKASAACCEFPAKDLTMIRLALDRLEDDEVPGVEDISTIVGWIHTHPHLSVFLSGTDDRTIGRWRNFDPNMRAVVADVFKRSFDEQIGVFNADCDRTDLELAEISIDHQLADQFREAVLAVYSSSDERVPTVLLASTRDEWTDSTREAEAALAGA